MSSRESTRLHRRELLAVLGAGIGAALSACGSTSPTSPTTTTTAPGTATPTPGGTTSAACAITPAETEGPYPDKTGMLGNSAFFRRDVTEGRPGLPLTLSLPS